MKKITEMTTQNESCNYQHADNCSKIYKGRAKHCLSLIIITAIFMPSLCSCEEKENDNKSSVLQAYELRISGKADKAEELLNELLKTDSTNAAAYFELARTKHHMFLGKDQIAPEKWEDIVFSLQQAVRLVPNNEIYAFYYAYACFFNAYISMMMEKPDAGAAIALTCDAFQVVLNLEPDCHEAQLYLVDIYAYLPENMGGDKEKAGVLASDLNHKDKIWGAMANARLMADNTDFVSYWQNVTKEAGNDAQASEELGRAYLLQSDTENGTKYFLEAINADITKRYLYMNLVRYHVMLSQQNPDLKSVHLEEAERLVNIYLQSVPALVGPVKAYAYGALGMIRMFGGDNAGSNEYRQMAASIDPYYSRGSGNPSEMLYGLPDEVKIHYSSFLMPF